MKTIVVKNLVKKYGNLTAVNDISFEIPMGSVFAFLGTNGAGKSTTIGCLTTTIPMTNGEVYIQDKLVGTNDEVIRHEIGVVFQSSLLDPLLTVRENLTLRAAFYTIGKTTPRRITELTKEIGMTSFIDRRYGKLSGGQKRRADIARALIHKPSILFLDEPTAGLDPQSRESVWQTVYDLQASSDLTVFLTTHYMEETERADQVCIIDKGKIIAQGTPQSLRATYSQNQLRLLGGAHQAQLVAALKSDGVSFTLKDDVVLATVSTSREAMQLLRKYDSLIDDFEFRHGNMDDVFLSVTTNDSENGGIS